VWAAVTDVIRYFERHGTRSGTVPKALLTLIHFLNYYGKSGGFF
jgi:hypothetical protein